jgi:diaminohydroxyphosphoribosylaminopyrimidine deaminase/5-amino-6-(5-phosphoribosylamino)uracil reductase
VAAHERAGTEHAEAKLLRLLTEAGRVSEVDTLVVTLEPCNHTGRTPPCVDAILGAIRAHPQIRTLWYGTPDPNPQVAGAGAARLRNQGLKTFSLPPDSPLALRCRQLVAPFVRWATLGLPTVTLKTAHRFENLSDREAWRSGLETRLEAANLARSESELAAFLAPSMIPPAGLKTFTQATSLEEAHRLRKQSDAILTGSGTVLADHPLFTVRHVEDFPPPRKPRLVAILDRQGRVPKAWLEGAQARGLLPFVFKPSSPSPAQALIPLLQRLAAEGAHRVLVEAGPQLSAAFLSQGLWDERVHFLHVAPDAKVGGATTPDLTLRVTANSAALSTDRQDRT